MCLPQHICHLRSIFNLFISRICYEHRFGRNGFTRLFILLLLIFKKNVTNTDQSTDIKRVRKGKLIPRTKCATVEKNLCVPVKPGKTRLPKNSIMKLIQQRSLKISEDIPTSLWTICMEFDVDWYVFGVFKWDAI